MPILLYNVEVWGVEKLDIIERVHTRICKILLKSSKYCHNTGAYGELGRYSVEIIAKQRMFNYWMKWLNGKQSKLCVNIYKIIFHLHSIDRFTSPWLFHIQKIIQGCGLNHVWLSQTAVNPKYLSSLVKQ
jgi:hypothetical protein